MSDIYVDLGSLEKTIRKKATPYFVKAAGRIRDDLYDEAQTAIVRFYTSYGPKYYERHYYNFMDQSFKKYYSNAHGTVFRGGVELTPDNLSDVYRTSTSTVFETVYAGFHGPASSGYTWQHPEGGLPAAPITESPMRRILERKKYIQGHILEYFD